MPQPVVARYEPDHDAGGWIVRAGTATAYGRTLVKAREAIVKALATARKTYGGDVVVKDDIRMSPAAAAALATARDKKAVALTAAAESQVATTEAARALVDDGLSLRDCAYLLGLSHARIQQLVKAKEES